MRETHHDIVIVGGGIAGAALATVLARGGLDVVVLEREAKFRDRVRGELMVPWGVAEAVAVGLDQVLLSVEDANPITRFIPYDDVRSHAEAELDERPLAGLFPSVPGMIGVSHPGASEGLHQAARRAGATTLRPVTDVTVSAGATPVVEYCVASSRERVKAKLVVGADGRGSAIRAQLGIKLDATEARTMLAGLLVTDLPDWPRDACAVGNEGDTHFLVFPQANGRARLYVGYDVADKDRFAGPTRERRFLDSFRLDCLPLGEAIGAATPAGPCAGFAMTDSWTACPVVEGAVLVGDAAGWNNPIIGQGLSVAMRDVRVLSEILLASTDWSASALMPYALERARRMRRLRIAADLDTVARGFGPEGRARRERMQARIKVDPELALVLATPLIGPELAPGVASDPAAIERLIGP
jgi:2-polyprenyl-6-methoxyphenol hydroxylase-like FAD-dependent oxidoreductase